MGRLNRRVERLEERARAASLGGYPDEGEILAAALERLSNEDLDRIEAYANRPPPPGSESRPCPETPREGTALNNLLDHVEDVRREREGYSPL